VVIAIWEYRRAERSEKRIAEVVHHLPRQVAEQVISRFALQNKGLIRKEQQSNTRFSVSYADVDGDGTDELMVQHPARVHGSALDVFGWREMEFRFLGGLAVGTPEGFGSRILTTTGHLEIGTRDTDWTTDLPYYLAPRLLQWYRWTGKDFEKAHETKEYTPADLEDRRAKLLQQKIDSTNSS
jgi:hypothetical protein